MACGSSKMARVDGEQIDDIGISSSFGTDVSKAGSRPPANNKVAQPPTRAAAPTTIAQKQVHLRSNSAGGNSASGQQSVSGATTTKPTKQKVRITFGDFSDDELDRDDDDLDAEKAMFG